MFREFARAVEARYSHIAKHELFVVDVESLFETYLAAFPEGSNPMFRTRTVHDCQCCKQFVRRLGKVVAIVGGKVLTVWDDQDVPSPYREVTAAMAAAVRSAPVKTVFRTKERSYGVSHNFDTKTHERHDHLCGKVTDKHYAKDPDTKRGEREAVFQVLDRGLTEIRRSDLEAVLELIDSNGLYRGAEHREAVSGFMRLLDQCKKPGVDQKLFVWENLDHRYARFRNTVIGTLLTDLAEGKDMEQAVKSFETKVAPANYKRPTAVITQKMVEQAVQTMTDLGIGGAIYRRYAKMSDVSVNDVLFVDNSARGKMKDGVAALLEGSVKKPSVDPKTADRVSSDYFVGTVLPKAKSVAVLVENRHVGNFVSLTAPKTDDGSRLFKWNNPFAWSYDGDVTDSVKQRVKAAGGNIDAELRVSLSWFNFDDLDLHARTPDSSHVYFGNKCGILDVDMNAVRGHTRNAVENLAFNRLKDGVYSVWVNQYNRRETADVGFEIELEFGGVVRQFSYGKAVSGDVQCLTLHVSKGVLTRVDSPLTEGSTSQEKWGVHTETAVPVTAVMFSPNHWGDQKVGARHLIFALENCKNPTSARGIYNEFLRADLDKHRKVFEILGNKTKCAPADEQISGVGFTAARGDYVTAVVDGKRTYLVTF